MRLDAMQLQRNLSLMVVMEPPLLLKQVVAISYNKLDRDHYNKMASYYIDLYSVLDSMWPS